MRTSYTEHITLLVVHRKQEGADGVPERKVEYMMPANSLVKAAKAYETWRWVTRSPGLSVVDVDTSTPDVPYGATFTTKVN